MTKRDKILFISILFFIVTVFLPVNISMAAAAVLIVASLFYTTLKEKLALLKDRKIIWYMLAFMIMVFISVFISENKGKALRYLDPRLPLFFFPLTIGLLPLSKNFRDKTLLAIAILVTFFSFTCLTWSVYRSVTFHNSSYLYNDALTDLSGQQSIYTSLLVNISIYIYAYFLFFKPITSGYKSLLVIALLFLYIISFLLASRNMMLLLYASTIGFSFYYIFKRRKYLEGFTLIIGLLLGVFLIFKFFPKTLNRFKELTYTQFNYKSMGKESHYAMEVTSDQWNGANFRLAAWRCGWELFFQNPVTGVDIGDKKDRLMEMYQSKNFQFAIKTGKNLHNNYLDILVSMGLIGLVLFLSGWVIFPLLIAWRRRDNLSLLIIFTFAFAMITEVYLDRSLGGMLLGFFIPFLLSVKPAKN
jgi:O-antigen ligase